MAKKQEMTFASAMYEARYDLRLEMIEMARVCSVSAHTISRWERGITMPFGPARESVIAWARTLPAARGNPILSALGIEGIPLVDAASSKRVVDAAIVVMSDALDVGPRSLRRALDRWMATLEKESLSIEAARVALATDEGQRAKPRRASP